MPWHTLGREMVADCRVFAVDRVRRRSPFSGREGDFFGIVSEDWVNVIALTDAGEVVLVRQYRHGSDEITVEIPGGIVDAGETPAEAARRELLEETGFTCREIVEIGRVRPNPAILNNWAYTLLATGLERGDQNLDEHEEIEVLMCPIDTADGLLADGVITHSLVVNAFLWYKLHNVAGHGSTAKRNED